MDGAVKLDSSSCKHCCSVSSAASRDQAIGRRYRFCNLHLAIILETREAGEDKIEVLAEPFGQF